MSETLGRENLDTLSTNRGDQEQGEGQEQGQGKGYPPTLNHLVIDFLTSSNPGCGSRVEMSMNTAESLEDGKGSKGCISTKPEEREYRRINGHSELLIPWVLFKAGP